MFIFKYRHDTSLIWATKNPILDVGEPGVEIDTGRFKLGDGNQPWIMLPYFVSEKSMIDHIDSQTPHPVYDDGPSLTLLYQNAKV